MRQHRVSRAGSSPRPVSAGHPRPARPTPHVSVLTRHPSHPAWSPFSPMTSQRPCLQIQAGIRMCSGPHSTHNGHRPHLHPSTERGTFLTRRSTNSTRRCVHVVEKGRRAGRTVRPASGFTSRTASRQAVSVRFLRPAGGHSAPRDRPSGALLGLETGPPSPSLSLITAASQIKGTNHPSCSV